MGLMQLMPATAERFGVSDPWNPRQNIFGGVQYLRFLLDMFGGDVTLAAAAYNAGENAVHPVQRRAALPRDAGLRGKGAGAPRRRGGARWPA